MSPRSVHWRSWEMNGSKKLMCDEDHIEQRQVHSPDDRESPPAPAGDGGWWDGDTAWVGSSLAILLVPFYTRLTWFYFAFFGEAFNHFVKCFSPDYLWALGHGLHLRMDFAVMFSVELFHCSAAMKVVWPLQTARVTFTRRATINGTYLVRRVDSLRPRKYFYKQLFIFHPSQGAGVGPVNVWIEPIRGDSASA